MKFLRSAPEQAPYELRAMTMVTRAAACGFGRPQRAMLDAVQELLLETDLDLDALSPVTPTELAAHVREPDHARQLIRLMVASSLADGPPTHVHVIRQLAKQRLVRFRLAFMRHSHLRIYMRNSRRLLGGVLPVVRSMLIFRGVLSEDAATVARYRALGQLPADTLGYAFHAHCTQGGLKFPGKEGGFPAGAIFHDFTHVLAGYDTSPEGEMTAAAFQAGFTRDDDDFFTALFAIVIHTAGINLAPFPMPVLRGRIGQGSLARDVFGALQRGSQMTIDLGDGWDFWKDVELPLEDARKRLGVPPLAAA